MASVSAAFPIKWSKPGVGGAFRCCFSCRSSVSSGVPYESVDRLQNVLAQSVFSHTKDAKKAAGRALGTLIEIITFYLLKSWGFEKSVAIETALPEYGNPEISHNVEFSLHPVLKQSNLSLSTNNLRTSATRMLAAVDQVSFPLTGFESSGVTLLTSGGLLRNSCIAATGVHTHLVATLDQIDKNQLLVTIVEQWGKPYAMFECKRVGVEEGMRKGPQTIEKAKQGAYVAKSVSSLHKLRTGSGELRGLIYLPNGTPHSAPYNELLSEVIDSNSPDFLRDFVLTVGVVSNHGNWFTSDNHNKELKVLAQSYDWLLFLTDNGLAQFITELLLSPSRQLVAARIAFLSSYAADKKENRFTKVRIDYKADQVLQSYFRDNATDIEKWFNVITPRRSSLKTLRLELSRLRDKNWRGIHGYDSGTKGHRQQPRLGNPEKVR
jgi:hypothetical protein